MQLIETQNHMTLSLKRELLAQETNNSKGGCSRKPRYIWRLEWCCSHSFSSPLGSACLQFLYIYLILPLEAYRLFLKSKRHTVSLGSIFKLIRFIHFSPPSYILSSSSERHRGPHDQPAWVLWPPQRQQYTRSTGILGLKREQFPHWKMGAGQSKTHVPITWSILCLVKLESMC